MLRLSRITGLLFVALAAVTLMTCTGCGKSKAANAPPPPQTLSEPVRPVEAMPSQTPAVPAAPDSELAKGESRALPAFVEPKTPPPPPPVTADARAGGQKVHVLAKGETIYALSRKYNVPPKNILAANNFKDPNHLAIGTKVYIPN
jgi:LysM repeat protein